jgi:hypothetical protein
LPSSELEAEKGVVVRQDSSSNLEEVNEGFALSGETVHNVFVVVGHWRLEEEGQVAQHGAQFLAVNVHSGEEFAQDNHIVHEGSGQERVLAHIVRADRVGTSHEDLRRVLVHCALRVTDEGHVLDHNFVVNDVLALGIKNSVSSHGVIKDTSL